MAQRKAVFIVLVDPSSAAKQSKAAEQGRRSSMSAAAFMWVEIENAVGSKRPVNLAKRRAWTILRWPFAMSR
ncbi:hypothetical protein GGI43DRAFT_380992 [Trichoderma evansii]